MSGRKHKKSKGEIKSESSKVKLDSSKHDNWAPHHFAVPTRIAVKTCSMCGLLCITAIKGKCHACTVIDPPKDWSLDRLRNSLSHTLFHQCSAALANGPLQFPPPAWSQIVARDDINLQPRDTRNGKLLVHACCSWVRADVLRLVLEKWPESVNAHDYKQTAPICLIFVASNSAKTANILACLRVLLDFKADLNTKDSSSLFDPLCGAVSCCSEDVVRALIDSKANVNLRAYTGQTPLATAVTSCRIAMVDLLIEHGARLRTIAGGATPLHLAMLCAGSDERAVAMLTALMKARKIDKLLNSSWMGHGTTLCMAAHRGYERAVSFLIRRKADVNASDPPGCACCPLYAAVKVAQLLVSSGACTHPLIGTSGLLRLRDMAEKEITNTDARLVRGCRSVETPNVTTCSKCGLDASNREAIDTGRRLVVQTHCRKDIGDKCSNPSCKGRFVVHIGDLGLTAHPVLKKCSRCLGVAYCSVECQREHWRGGHKAECKAAQSTSASEDDP